MIIRNAAWLGVLLCVACRTAPPPAKSERRVAPVPESPQGAPPAVTSAVPAPAQPSAAPPADVPHAVATPLPDGVASIVPHVTAQEKDREAVVVIPMQESIPRCVSNKTFELLRIDASGGVTIERTTLAGKALATLARGNREHGLGVDHTRGWAVDPNGVRKVGSNVWTPVAGSERWYWPSFVPGTSLVATHLLNDAGGISGGTVVDWKTGQDLVRTIGAPHAIARDGAFFFLRVEEVASEDQSPSYTDILRLYQGQVRHMARVTESSDLGVSDLAALSADFFVMRVSEMHEHRWLQADGEPFYSGGVGHGVGGSRSKEQFELTFSDDGRYATFAERNWNELTYIIVVDLVAKRRIELPYFGSFPVVVSGLVLFASDPTFVSLPFSHRHDVTGLDEGPDPPPTFRQIEKFGIYAFHLASRRLCNVAVFDEYAQPYAP